MHTKIPPRRQLKLQNLLHKPGLDGVTNFVVIFVFL